MNELIHPAVKAYLIKDVERVRLSGKYEFYFLEAALLIEENYDKMDADKRICLTEAGREAAEQVFEKHRVLTECLVTMGVDPGIAEKDACRMEHLISPETLAQMKIYVGRELAV